MLGAQKGHQHSSAVVPCAQLTEEWQPRAQRRAQRLGSGARRPGLQFWLHCLLPEWSSYMPVIPHHGNQDGQNSKTHVRVFMAATYANA